MIKLKSLLLDNLYRGDGVLKEEVEENNSFIRMYHGGSRWKTTPSEIQSSGKGRYEGGVGIYLTNSYHTARKYAKGGRVVHLVYLNKNYTDIKDVRIPTTELIQFVKGVRGLRHKEEIIADITNRANQMGKSDIYAEILNNLIINYEAGSGKVGIEITKFFVSKGIDASLQSQSGEEQWLVVFNPKIINKVEIVDPSKVTSDMYILPKINI